MSKIELNSIIFSFLDSVIFMLIVCLNYFAVAIVVKFVSHVLLPIVRKLLNVYGRYTPFGWTILLDEPVKPIDLRNWIFPRFNRHIWRRLFTFDPDDDNERRKRKPKKDENAEFAKWVAYLYIIGLGTICFYLSLRSYAGPETNDWDYNIEYVLRTGSSAMDYLVYFGPYYGWEWDAGSRQYIQVELFGVDYDSDIDPDQTSFKPYRAETEEEEVEFLLKPDDKGIYPDVGDESD